MLNNVYSLKNKLSGRYGDVFTYPTDAFAVTRLKEVASVPEAKINLKEVELYRVATMEIETGKITAMLEPVKVDIPEENKSIIEMEEEATATTK